MKTKVLTLLMCMLLCLSLPMTALAAGIGWDQRPMVIDAAGLLTSDELGMLDEKAHNVTNAYGSCVGVIVLADTSDFSGNGRDIGMDVYEAYDFGYGDSKDGILLFLGMDTRDCAFVVYGDIAKRAYTNYGQIQMENTVVPYLSNGEFAQAFDVFIDMCDEYLGQAAAGAPVDGYLDPSMIDESMRAEDDSTLIKVAVSVGISLLIAFIVCSAWAAQMKTAKKKTTAHDYIPKNGFTLRTQSDMFLYRTQSRTRIQSSSSGGGTSSNSRGYSGRSGKF